MGSFSENMREYRAQLEKGAIQKAYKGLLEYLLGLKTYLQARHPQHFVSGLYDGYMDMSYFSFTPEALKQRKLKIAVVFIHETFRFEVWLGGYNKQVQSQYWKVFKESGWDLYRLVPTPAGADSIVEHTLVENPDFSDLDALTRQIESGTLEFISAVEGFLSARPKGAGEDLA